MSKVISRSRPGERAGPLPAEDAGGRPGEQQRHGPLGRACTPATPPLDIITCSSPSTPCSASAAASRSR